MKGNASHSPKNKTLMHNKPRTIGILGGSFNPAHAGHVHLSREAMKTLGLDAVWWLVSPQNPLKSSEEMAGFGERFSSAKAAAKRHRRIHVSDFEQVHGTRYTADTLKLLTGTFPDIRFVWLMGADNLAQIHHWQNWREIFSTVRIAVYDRKPYTFTALCGKAAHIFRHARVSPRELAGTPLPAWCFIHGRRHPLSATFMRNLLGHKAFMGHNEDAVNGKDAAKRR